MTKKQLQSQIDDLKKEISSLQEGLIYINQG